MLAIEDKLSLSNQVRDMYQNDEWLADSDLYTMTTNLGDNPVITSSTWRIGHFALATEVLPSMWSLNSGASYYMHNRNNFNFSTYKCLSNPIWIQLANKTCVFMTHHSSVQVQNHPIDALHIPSFRYSLLSVAELDYQEYHIKFGNGKCSIQTLSAKNLRILPVLQ